MAENKRDKVDLIFQLYDVDSGKLPPPRQSVSSSKAERVFELYGINREPSQGPVRDFIAGVANTPAAVANVISQSLTGKPIAAPPTGRDSTAFRAGQGFTNAMAAGTAAGIAGGRVAPAPRSLASGNVLERTESAIRGFARDVGTTFRRNPVRTSLAEGAMGATASLGGSFAANKYPDSAEARAVGELLGGFTPMAAAGATKAAFSISSKVPGISWAVRKANEAYGNISLTGTRRRVSNRIDRATQDREGAILRMNEELSPGAKELMTPAMRTDSDGLMALERSVLNAVDSGAASEEFIKNYRAINDAIIADIRGVRSPSGADRLQLQLSELGLFVDEEIRLAAQRADSLISRSLTSLDNEQVSAIVRRELDTSLKKARETESAFWSLVPNGVRVPTENASGAYRALKAEKGAPQLKNLPTAARKWLDPKSPGYKKNFFQDASIKDMRALYSELRSEARNARSGTDPNFDTARMADELANAVLEDMNIATGNPEMEGYEPLQAAIDFSRQLNQKFSNGAVGRVLRMGPNAQEVIPPNLTLQNTIGVGGPKAGETVDRILEAADQSPDARNAMADYMRNLFLKAVRHGEGPVNVTTGRAFIRNNDAVLKRFPELRQEFAAAVDAQDAANVAAKTLPKAMSQWNIATMYIEKSPDRAWTEILGSRNSASSTRRLISLARQDTSGAALNELRGSFLDHVIKNATDEKGVISHTKLSSLLESRSFREAQSELLTREQRMRWDRILRTTSRFDKRNTTGTHEGVFGDKPGLATGMLSRLLGGTIGRRAARAGVGGSIQTVQVFSNAFSKLAAAGATDPAKRLIIDAVMSKDDVLFKALLDTRPNLPADPQVRQRVNAWVGLTLYNLGNEE